MGKVTELQEKAHLSTRGHRKGGVALRDAIHVLVVAAGWALFFVWWEQVLRVTSLPDAALALLVILSVSLLTALATVGWVRYNLGIYRRKGPRRTVPDASEAVGTDALGRKLLHPGAEELRAARVVTVSLSDGNGKSLSPGGA
jgi:hypothetical protein